MNDIDTFGAKTRGRAFSRRRLFVWVSRLLLYIVHTFDAERIQRKLSLKIENIESKYNCVNSSDEKYLFFLNLVK